MTRLLLLLALLAPAALRGQAVEFPNRPAGQVLDSGERLGSERRLRIESELGRLRAQYGIDVMVVLWGRSLPPETSPEELAERLGQTWAREDLWAVVLHLPDSVLRPAVVTGGAFLGTVTPEGSQQALRNALVRGMKERSPNSQVEALGLEIGTELVFLRHRRDFERRSYVQAHAEQLRAQESRHQKMILRAVVATLLALLAVGAVAVLYIFKRQPADLEFPQTRWRRRLGAEWSGGGHIVVSLPTRAS